MKAPRRPGCRSSWVSFAISKPIANTTGAGNQFVTAAIKRLADAGIVVGDRGSAYKAMDQILNTEIPDLRKASGIQRLAGPEIQAVGKQIGTANLPPTCARQHHRQRTGDSRPSGSAQSERATGARRQRRADVVR